MPRDIGSRRIGGIALLVITLAAACSDSSTSSGPGAFRIEAVAGDGQVALPGAELPRPLAVRVTNSAGVSVADVTVEFAADGSGPAPRTARTNARGLAAITWMVGSGPGRGTQVVRARVAGDARTAATFTLRALGGITKVRGDGQAATPGTLLPQAPTVLLLDTDQRPIAGATISWSAVVTATATGP